MSYATSSIATDKTMLILLLIAFFAKPAETLRAKTVPRLPRAIANRYAYLKCHPVSTIAAISLDSSEQRQVDVDVLGRLDDSERKLKQVVVTKDDVILNFVEALNDDFVDLKQELNDDFVELAKNFSQEYKNDFGNFRQEYKNDFDNFRQEYKNDLDDFRQELKQDFAGLAKEFKSNQDAGMWWMFIGWAAISVFGISLPFLSSHQS